MTAKTGTEKSRISRERAKLGLVQLIAWVPADKLTACQDAVDEITTPAVFSDETMRAIMHSASKAAEAQRHAIDQITKGETNAD